MANPLKSSTPLKPHSRAEWIASLPVSERQQCLSGLSAAEQAAALYEWRFWARGNQVAPQTVWDTWLLLAGRGFGKTRSGAEWIRERVETGGARRIAFIAPTPADARDVMIEGQSGILAVSPPWCRPEYQPSKRRIVWPNGAQATVYSGYEPDQLRGPEHDTAWCDELASWAYPNEAWDNLLLGMRLPDIRPQRCVTTTPKPIRLLRDLLKDPGTVVTSGSTYENASNLPQSFIHRIQQQYEGTSLGQQEIYAQLLDEAAGALWTRALVEKAHLEGAPPTMERIVVAIDPAAATGDDSSETGVIVAGLAKGHAYILEDVSGRVSPDTWGNRAVGAFHRLRADRILGERNNGGDMVRHTVRTVDPLVSYKDVWASKGKHTRAEPIAALYEQGKVHHVGAFPLLEDQLCTWVPGMDSPDRLDAMVWAVSELMLDPQPDAVKPISLGKPSYWT
jgi:phage terminase large subunit-like protein